MAIIKKHWLAFTVQMVLFFSGVVWMSQPAYGQDAGGKYSELEMIDYSRLQQLRIGLCLADQDMAAMGCSGEQAEIILTNLRTWYFTNKSVLEDAQLAYSQARSQLQAVTRAIQVGTADSSAHTRLILLAKNNTDTDQALRRVKDAAWLFLDQSTSEAQSEFRLNVAKNIGMRLPTRYRYAPDISADQASQIKRAWRNRRSSDSRRLLEDVLEYVQTRQDSEAHRRSSQFLKNVLEVSEQVIPTPQEILILRVNGGRKVKRLAVEK